MALKFSIKKYRKHLTEKQRLTEIMVDKLIYLNEMDLLDGQELDILLAQGKLILIEWCEEC